jgi:hypothetical protein
MLTKRNGDPAARNSPPKCQSSADFRPDGDGACDGQCLFTEGLPPTYQLLYNYNN